MNNWSGARQHGRRPICLSAARLCSTQRHIGRSTCASARRVCRACYPTQARRDGHLDVGSRHNQHAGGRERGMDGKQDRSLTFSSVARLYGSRYVGLSTARCGITGRKVVTTNTSVSQGESNVAP